MLSKRVCTRDICNILHISQADFKYIRLHNETYKASENGGAEGGEKRYYYGLYQIKLFARKVDCGNIKNRFAAAVYNARRSGKVAVYAVSRKNIRKHGERAAPRKRFYEN